MQSAVDISVVVTTYNQDERALTLTLNSILQQICTSFEIIVADDCSKIDPSPFIHRFFDEKGFENYSIVRASENIGTVANVARGISAASGHIIKPLSPGDALFGPSTLANIVQCCVRASENIGTVANVARGISAASGHIIKPLSPGDALFGPSTLANIVQCCNEHDIQLGFGGIISYLSDGSFSPYNAPRALDLYTSPKQDSGDVLRSHILKTDWIPGCSLFYGRDLMLPYLHELADRAHVRYCEDLACPLCAADGVRIGYLGGPVIWYEMGTGISTSGGSASVRRMYNDHHNFYHYLPERIVDQQVACRALRAFSLREFVALHTPFYRMAQKLKLNQYAGSNTFDMAPFEKELHFFNACRMDVITQ